jgi:hypothetical protein
MTRSPQELARLTQLAKRWIMGAWYAMGAMAIGLTLYGTWSLYQNALIHERWLGATLGETTGIVESYTHYRTQNRGRSDTTSTYATYRYTADDGHGEPVTRRRTQHVRHWGPIGSPVAVRYVSGNPAIASLAEDDSELTTAVLPIAISLIFWTLFLLPAIVTWRVKRKLGPPARTLPGSSLPIDPPKA